MNKTVISVLGTLFGAILVAGCNEELIEDATFRLWCDDHLCSWRLDEGHVREAATWHEGDHGVEFVDTPTTISQALKASPKCLVFTTIADVAASAQVTVGVDFTGDGVVDYEQPIAAIGFHEATTQITAPRTTQPPRIFISKKGQGRAVLAQIQITSANNCSAPPVQLHDRVLGDACSVKTPSECKSGVCCEGICAECCVKPRGVDVDANGTVTTAPVVDCAGGAACTRRDVNQSGDLFSYPFSRVPLQCNPGSRTRAAGAVCLADDDCTSGACDGASSSVKAFGFDAPDACAGDFPDAGGEKCEFTQVREGRCL